MIPGPGLQDHVAYRYETVHTEPWLGRQPCVNWLADASRRSHCMCHADFQRRAGADPVTACPRGCWPAGAYPRRTPTRSGEPRPCHSPIRPPDGLRAAASHYPGSTQVRPPLAFPLGGDLSGLPSLLIPVGSAELLFEDTGRVCRAAVVAGVSARLTIWPRKIHVWRAFAFILAEGRSAIQNAGTFFAASAKR